MKSFKDWRIEESPMHQSLDGEESSEFEDLNMKRLGGAQGLLGSKTIHADSTIVTRLVSAIKSELSSNKNAEPTSVFEDFMKAMPVAWSIATGKDSIGRSYSGSSLHSMGNER